MGLRESNFAYKPEKTISTVKNGGGNIMIWGSLHHNTNIEPPEIMLNYMLSMQLRQEAPHGKTLCVSTTQRP